MSLLAKLKYWWGDQPAPSEPSLPDEVETELTVAPDVPKVIHGGIHKAKHKDFNIDDVRHGGRVVKVMPRQLRHMKELSEKTDD